jgi:NAD-dependent DNA ligase
MNKLREEQNILLRDQGKKELELYKNARNTASGGLRIKDSKEVAVRGLEAFYLSDRVCHRSQWTQYAGQ